ncbi:MAG: hypothetical protein KGL68_16030 [Burkholderiales bacterium]|nr:hypothetical protein [Burkholderiales bacterium]
MDSQPARSDFGNYGAASPLAAAAAFGDEGQPRYCPTDLLGGFALLMAGHGRCVHIDVMLGDPAYARWQLACARELDDGELAAVTERLAAYFA